MKLKNFLALMAVASLTTGFTSCDDDDDNANVQAPGTQVGGDFYGVAAITTPDFQGIPGSTSNDSTFVTRIIKQDNGKYSVVLPESSEAAAPKGMSMPTITVKDLDLTETSKGIFTYNADMLNIAVSANKKAVLSNFKVNISTVEKKANVSYGLQYGIMPMTIKYDFKTLLKNDFIVGSFMGVNTTTIKGESTPDSMNVASIELQKDGKYTLVLPEKDKSPKSFRGMTLPSNIRLTDLEISGEGNTFTFANAEVSVKTPQMPIVLKNVKGSIKGNDIKLSYDLKPGGMPIFITFTYDGAKFK